MNASVVGRLYSLVTARYLVNSFFFFFGCVGETVKSYFESDSDFFTLSPRDGRLVIQFSATFAVWENMNVEFQNMM